MTDMVFHYSLTGTLLGSWSIGNGGGSPTGITIDPTAPIDAGTGLSLSTIWIVDAASDRVYQFRSDKDAGTATSRSPISSFVLAAGNTNPQGIADPPPNNGVLLSASGTNVRPISRATATDAALLSWLSALDNGSEKKKR
jgi:hypothetical protein